MMTGFWMKIVICPAVVAITDWITGEVYYASWFQAIMMGVALAIVGHLMEVLMLRPGRLWMLTILDFFATAALVFLGQFVFPGAFVTVVGALLISSFLAIIEYYVHRWLIFNGKTEKAV